MSREKVEFSLKKACVSAGNKTYTYDYDAEGIRTEKVVDGVTHTYLTLNGRVIRESFPYGNSSVVMQFIYDNQGKPFSILYSTDGGNSFAQYYYAINAQGDVEGIFFTRKNTETGKQEVRWMGHYTYDAWGNVTSIIAPNNTIVTNPANLMLRNPLRYRGYYYDSETGFYYLQSRYYDPKNCRFINADGYCSTGQGFTGTNMFAYCNNCPVIYSDHSGHISKYSSVALFEGGVGVDDYDVYDYIYETPDGAKTGKVYIYTDKSDVFMRSGEALPEGFSVGTDIIVLDSARGVIRADNPDFCVYNSCCITDRDQMESIIDIICGYAAIYAKSWYRTNDKKSLYVEWEVHNTYAPFDDSAKHVNFDYDEKGKGRLYFHWKAFTRGIEKLFMLKSN